MRSGDDTMKQLMLNSEDAKALARLPVSELRTMLRKELKRRGLLSTVDAAIARAESSSTKCPKCDGELADTWVYNELLGMQCLGKCKRFFENPLNTLHDNIVNDIDNNNINNDNEEKAVCDESSIIEMEIKR
jgi:hypothetical protein